ncbi:MAG: DUF3017 domain-containing protein [Nocardioidaceae bacterium]
MIDTPRRRHRTPGSQAARGLHHEWPVGVVLLGIAGSVLWVALDHFRPGVIAFAGSVAAAALLRLLLPTRLAGLLVVRSRVIDVVTLLVLAAGAMTLAIVVPGV